MGERIVHLEDLVKRLIAERPHALSPTQSDPGVLLCTPEETPGAESSDATTATTGTGKTVMDGVHSVYVGGDDLSVVLQEASTLPFIHQLDNFLL